jgi:cell division protein FtsW
VRWYSLGFASVQPSEFLKPAFVVVGRLADGREPGDHGPPGKSWSFAIAGHRRGFLALQPDFGQACLCCSPGA